jgi:hypothetical protein
MPMYIHIKYKAKNNLIPCLLNVTEINTNLKENDLTLLRPLTSEIPSPGLPIVF